MNGQEVADRKRRQLDTGSQSRGLWIMAVAALGLAGAWALAFTLFGVAAEHSIIQGSGVRIAEERLVGPFKRISLGDLGTCIVTQGTGAVLTVETDDNLLRYVEIRVRSGTLVLSLNAEAKRRGIQPSKGLTYYLSVNEIAGLEVADSGRIQALDLDVEDLEIAVHDSGNLVVDSLRVGTLRAHVEDSGYVYLSGELERQEVTVQDSGRYLAGRLQSWTTIAEVGDSGEATLWVRDALDITITDSGHVSYYGAPKGTHRLSDNATLTELGEP